MRVISARCRRRGAGVQSPIIRLVLGVDYGRVEEGGGGWRDGCGGDLVYEKEISGGGAGDGGWPDGAGDGISGELRESAAGAAGISRAWHAGDGDGSTGRQANYRGGGAERSGSVGRNWGIGQMPARDCSF